MKNRFTSFWSKGLFVLGVIAIGAVIGFSLAGCPTGGGGGGDPGTNPGNTTDTGSGGKVPKELQGNWLRDAEGAERYLVFTADRWGTDSGSFADAKRDATWVVTSATADKIEYQEEDYPLVSSKGSFNWVINGTTLTITNSGIYLSNATYTKQP
jgi:hypothetical protein